MHNALTGEQVFPHSRAYPLSGSFLLGLTYCDRRERDSDRISYSDACTLFLFSGVSYCDQREHVFIFVYETKEKEHQNNRQFV
jgi:hypothetical protein